MENKTTTELLDLLWKIESKNEPTDKEWEQHEAATAELAKRSPFNQLLGVREERNEFSHDERLENLEDDVKLLKRHKHDPHSGDVMTRI